MANESNHIHQNGRNLLDDYLIFNLKEKDSHFKNVSQSVIT